MGSKHSAYRPTPKQMYIACEGLPYLAATLAVAFLFLIFGVVIVAVLLFCLAGFIAFFFRNPSRNPPNEQGIVVAPADGRVISVAKGRTPFTEKESQRISIFMSVLNVHINRFPVEATVKKVFYLPGKFLVASLDKASEFNERNTLILEDREGREFAMVQIAGLVARRIVCYVKEGDKRLCGERFGLIRFGSRVDLYLPPEVRAQVVEGDRTTAGETVIGRF